MRYRLVAAFLAIGSARLSAQTLQELPANYCSFAGQVQTSPLILFDPDPRLKKAVAFLLGQVGLRLAVTLKSGSVENATVYTVDGAPFLVYNASLMTQVDSIAKTPWASMSVLAHEIGHFVLRHDLIAGGSRFREELDADYYSGFMMYNVGATSDEATAAVSIVTNDLPSATHPRRGEREAEVRAGWTAAFQSEHHRPDFLAPALDLRSPQTTEPDTAGLFQAAISKYLGRAVLFTDDNPTFVTARGFLIGVNSLGQTVIVGRRKPTKTFRYAWTLALPTGEFGVDSGGLIWSLAYDRKELGYIAVAGAPY